MHFGGRSDGPRPGWRWPGRRPDGDAAGSTAPAAAPAAESSGTDKTTVALTIGQADAITLLPGPSSPARQSAGRSVHGRRWLTFATLALAGFIGMGESGALVQEATPGGQTALSSLYGLGQLTHPAVPPYLILQALGQVHHLIAHWLIWNSLFTVLFIAGYGLLGSVLLAGDAARSARRLLAGTVCANLAEVAIASVAFIAWVRPGNPVPHWLAWLLHAVTMATWLLAIVLLAWIGLLIRNQPAIQSKIEAVARALKVQRFSVLIVAILAVLAIARGSDVLEQLPDIERSWFNGYAISSAQPVLAIAAQVALAVLIFCLGRLRMHRAHDKFARPRDAEDPRKPSRHWTWALAAGALALVALVLWVGNLARVSWAHVIAVAAVLLVIAGVSLLVQWREKVAQRRPQPEQPQRQPLPGKSGKRPAHRASSQQLIGASQYAGDMLAAAVLVIPCLGLVRAFTVPALLGFAPGWLAVAAGIVLALLGSAVVGPWAAREYDSAERPLGRRNMPGAFMLALAIFAIFLAVDLWLLIWPLTASRQLGVLATAVIGIGTLGGGLTVLAYLAQNHQPLPIFALAKLQTTPVISLILVIALAGAAVDNASGLHQVPVPAGPISYQPRPDLTDRLSTWLAGAPEPVCASHLLQRSVDGHPVTIEPFVLVAASGGGIRAAWWTVMALEELRQTWCGESAIFAVSSVSGGSLGTVVVASSPDAASASQAMLRIARPDALSAAVNGLLLHDMVAGLTGIDLAGQLPGGGSQFADRATLMEQAWEREDPGLSRSFAGLATAQPWNLLLNSTAVGSGCRAVLATVPLSLAGPAGSPPQCGLSGIATPLPGGYDLFAALPCLRGIDMGTAAMLSARFAFVTPSGVIDSCVEHGGTWSVGGQPVERFIDGGYADSSGLGTLAGLAPQLVTLIGQHNAAALAAAGPGQPITLVVPVTAYLQNSVQTAPAAPGFPGTAEPLIPGAAGSKAAAAQLTGFVPILRTVGAETGIDLAVPCPTGDRLCADAQSAAATAVPYQLIVIAPTQLPRVAAPLGWVLSSASEEALNDALTGQAGVMCGQYPPQSVTALAKLCLPGLGRLGDLLAYLGGSAARR